MGRPRIHEFCTIEDCGKKHYGRGYCKSHYMSWWREQHPGYHSAVVMKLYRTRYQPIVIELLGGKCADCGTTDDLELSHPNGDGKAHRERMRTRNQYQWLYFHQEDLHLVELRCESCHDEYDKVMRRGQAA